MAIVHTLIKLGFSNSLVTLCLCLVLLLALGLFLHYTYYVYDARFMELASKIPGPRWYPFIGSAYGFGTDSPANFRRMLNIILANNLPVAKLWLGPMLYLSLRKAKDIEAILLSKTLLTKPSIYHLMGPLGEGLVGSSGETWKRHRKSLRPSFSFQAMEHYLKIFNEKSRILTQVLETQNGKESVDIHPYLSNFFFDTTYYALFSTDSNEQTNECKSEDDFPTKMIQCRGAVMQRMLKPWLYPDILFNMTAGGKLYKYNLDVGSTHVKDMIRRKKEDLKSNSAGEVLNDKKSDSTEKYSFINHVIENVIDKDLTEDEVVQEILTILITGLETSMSFFSIFLFVLSRRFDIQEKLVEEIHQVLGTTEEDITYEDIRNLTYLDRVFKETMRLFSVLPLYMRKITEEFTLPSGYTLPKGCNIVIADSVLHRDPDIYPNPNVFDPDHFLPERVAARSPYSYIPFSAGPRDCIGKKFAELEVKVALINLLRKFWITPTDETLMLTLMIVMSPINEVNVGLRTRTAVRPVITGGEKLTKTIHSNIKYLNVHFKDSYL